MDILTDMEPPVTDRSTIADLPMKIATFNINNINRRLPNLLVWLKRAKPDIVALQELKSTDGGFPQCGHREGRLWRGVARTKDLERRGDPGAKHRSGADPQRPARRQPR